MKSREQLLVKQKPKAAASERHQIPAAFALSAGQRPLSPLSSSRCCKLISNNLILNVAVAAKPSPNKLPGSQQKPRLATVS